MGCYISLLELCPSAFFRTIRCISSNKTTFHISTRMRASRIDKKGHCVMNGSRRLHRGNLVITYQVILEKWNELIQRDMSNSRRGDKWTAKSIMACRSGSYLPIYAKKSRVLFSAITSALHKTNSGGGVRVRNPDNDDFTRANVASVV